MSHLPKPKVHHPLLQKNAVGLTRRDYEGALSTLCAGCGHDSITAAIIQATEQLTGAPAGSVSFGTEGPYLNALGMDTVILGPGSVE